MSLIAPNGKTCPLCLFYSLEDVEALGLRAGWYKEDEMSRFWELIPCDHQVPSSFITQLNLKTVELKEELRDCNRRRKLYINLEKARDDN